LRLLLPLPLLRHFSLSLLGYRFERFRSIGFILPLFLHRIAYSLSMISIVPQWVLARGSRPTSRAVGHFLQHGFAKLSILPLFSESL
jgi:hypothetical protein